jgi:hypothetical protein
MLATAQVTSGALAKAGEVTACDLDTLALLRAAIEESRVQQKVVAATLGVDHAYLSRMLTGEKPFPVRSVDRLPVDVRRIYARLLAEHEGWRVVGETARHTAIRRVIDALLVELSLDTDQAGLPARVGYGLKAGLR